MTEDAAATQRDLMASGRLGATSAGMSCAPDGGHCITCSDEARAARVVRVDRELGLAHVVAEGASEPEEVDITLVDEVEVDQSVLVHGGVALSVL